MHCHGAKLAYAEKILPEQSHYHDVRTYGGGSLEPLPISCSSEVLGIRFSASENQRTGSRSEAIAIHLLQHLSSFMVRHW